MTSGAATLKDAMNEALRYWVANVEDTYYCIGTVAGPHPYPTMVRDFQSVIGDETREQMLAAEGKLPDAIVCAVGGGSSAMGIFHPFLDDPSVKLYGVEAAGRGLARGAPAAASQPAMLPAPAPTSRQCQPGPTPTAASCRVVTGSNSAPSPASRDRSWSAAWSKK